MALQDKQTLINDIKTRINAMVTADTAQNIEQVITDILSGYDVQKATAPGADTDGRDFLTAFLDAKRIQGRTDGTIERYRYMITRMLAAVAVPVRSITAYHLRGYMMQCKAAGCKDSTIEGMRCIYNSFFGWLHREGLITCNPCANIGAVKVPKVSRLPFSDTEVERMRESCTTDRDRALLAFMLSTGCRIGEVCGLNRDAVDFQRLQCRVYGKGRKERVVYLDTVAAMLLRRYLNNRTDTNPALFVSGRRKCRMWRTF